MPQTTVGAIIVDRDTGRILLTRRAIQPYRGYWCLPGGHIEPDEPARTAVIREVREETGLDVELGFFDYFDEIIPERGIHAVVLAFVGTTSGIIAPDAHEVIEAGWFSVEEALAVPLAFEHGRIISAYAAAKRQAPTRREES